VLPPRAAPWTAGNAQKGGAPVLKVEPNRYDLRQSDGKLMIAAPDVYVVTDCDAASLVEFVTLTSDSPELGYEEARRQLP